MKDIKRASTWTAVLAAAVFAAGAAHAAKPVIYPAKGQSAQQQQADDGQCYSWAKGNTGIDPAAVASAPPPPSGPAVGGGERARGALRGAAVGGIVDGGDGARTGAAVGVVAGGARARQNQRAEQASAQSNQQGAMDTFYRAYGACMEGRGYTIK
ncbi:MAG TPA: hypothetical protein VMJ14_13305 [Burkholderiales bacterium]|nr:hypothetical protein [Burkholderiales bacterium]